MLCALYSVPVENDKRILKTNWFNELTSSLIFKCSDQKLIPFGECVVKIHNTFLFIFEAFILFGKARGVFVFNWWNIKRIAKDNSIVSWSHVVIIIKQCDIIVDKLLEPFNQFKDNLPLILWKWHAKTRGVSIGNQSYAFTLHITFISSARAIQTHECMCVYSVQQQQLLFFAQTLLWYRTANAPNALNAYGCFEYCFILFLRHFHRSSIYFICSPLILFQPKRCFFFFFWFFFYCERIWEQNHLMRPPKRPATITHTIAPHINIKHQTSSITHHHRYMHKQIHTLSLSLSVGFFGLCSIYLLLRFEYM